MSKPFTYWVDLALVVTLCTLTTFNPVYAGRWMDRLLHRDACKAPADCCEVVSQGDANCSIVPADPCSVLPTSPCTPVPNACDLTPMEMSVPNLDREPAIATPEITLPKVATPDIQSPAVTSPAIVAPAETTPVIDTPVKPTVNEVAPVTTPDPPKVEPPTPVVEPAPKTLEPVVDPAPAKPAPATDDLFGTEPAKPAPAKPAPTTDDLFGTEPAKPAPAEPAPTKPAPATDDLFGTEPAKPAPTKPAPATDDLFGTEPAKPAPAEPAPTKPAPAKPAPAKPDTAIDDLFGAEPAKPAPVEPAPAKPAPAKPDTAIEDLFGTEPAAGKATKTDPAETDIGDLFKAEPPAKPAPVPEKEPNLDELFGKPIRATTDEPIHSELNTDDPQLFDKVFSQSGVAKEQPKQDSPAPADTVTPPLESATGTIETAAESDPDLELDKLFGVGAFTAPTQFGGAEYRQWVDNTGTYAVNARLTVIYSDKIKLTKENGKSTTVALSRLSEADFGYVQWVASNLTGEQSSILVKRNSAPNVDLNR